jgi:peptidoglycan/LPS O-acetylase OafA/YrhL
LFVAGVLTALHVEHLRKAPLWLAIAALVGAVVIGRGSALALWAVFVLIMLNGVSASRRSLFDRGFNALFDSKFAQWFGARSYGIYILHWPILTALIVLLPLDALDRRSAFAILLVATATLTVASAAFLHVTFEAPLNALGGRLRRQMHPKLKLDALVEPVVATAAAAAQQSARPARRLAP